jgi:hypothetical protein
VSRAPLCVSSPHETTRSNPNCNTSVKWLFVKRISVVKLNLDKCIVLQIPNLQHPWRRLAAAILAVSLLASALVTGAPVLPAQADDGTNGISGAPSDGTAVDDRSRFSYQVDPGQHLDDFYLVRNTGTSAQTMKIFATDAFDAASGAFSLLDTKTAPKDSGSWVKFPNGTSSIDVPLAAGASKIVSFRLTAPADASPGDHAGGIVISVATPQGNIIVDRRVATRMYVRVKGAIQAALTVGNIAAAYLPTINPFSGSTVLKFTVRNNGNVALGANLVVRVKSYFGISASGLVRSSVSEMLPGSTRVVSVEVPGVAQVGYLSPQLSLVPTVDTDALSPGPLRTTTRDTNMFVTPWWLLILIAIAGAIWALIVFRRRRDATHAEKWIAHVESEARHTATDELVPATVGARSDSGVSRSVDSPTNNAAGTN